MPLKFRLSFKLSSNTFGAVDSAINHTVVDSGYGTAITGVTLFFVKRSSVTLYGIPLDPSDRFVFRLFTTNPDHSKNALVGQTTLYPYGIAVDINEMHPFYYDYYAQFVVNQPITPHTEYYLEFEPISTNDLFFIWDFAHNEDVPPYYTHGAINRIQASEFSYYIEAEGIFPPIINTIQVPSLPSDAVADLGAQLASDGGEACDCHFEWGPTTAYGNVTADTSQVTGDSILHSIAGMTPGVVYHYRAVATNSVATTYGSDMTLSTEYFNGTDAPFTTLDAIVTTLVSDVTIDTAKLTGQANFDSLSAGFRFKRKIT